MAKKRVKLEIQAPTNDKTLYAFLATILSIIGFIIALIVKRNDKYVMYYAKHSLVIFIIGVIGGTIAQLFSFIPIMGAIINFAIFVIVFLAWILSWVYALSGKEKAIPVITQIAEKFDF